MTRTLVMDRGAIDDLRRALEAAGFGFRPLDHAHFSARADGVVVNAYRSGKVVVQGKRATEWLERLDIAGPVDPGHGLDEPAAGSDESGKGDYFGPLVVAAVAVEPAQVAELRSAGVRDCKAMGDAAILRVAFAIRQLCPHAVRVLTVAEYNAAHERTGNVALFLSDLHAEVLSTVVDEAPGCRRVVIDRFTTVARLRDALAARGVELPAEIRARAEDHPAVAAASVLARAEFLIELERLGGEHGVTLPKGAGAPVEHVARRIFVEGGLDALRAVAKVHFRTTGKVSGLF